MTRLYSPAQKMRERGCPLQRQRGGGQNNLPHSYFVYETNSNLNTWPRQIELPPGQNVAVLLPRRLDVVRDFVEAPRPQAHGLPHVVGP